MKPVAQRIIDPKSLGLSRQEQERRLEGVVGVVGVSDYAPAHGHHHGPMALHQALERQIVSLSRVSLEQSGVREPGPRPLAEKAVNLSQRGPAVNARDD